VIVENVTMNPIGNASPGKLLGRVAAGGALHFDPDQREWPQPQPIEIKVGDEVVYSGKITGFDVRRDQFGPTGDTRLTFVATEP
jgi:hypothetical protein